MSIALKHVRLNRIVISDVFTLTTLNMKKVNPRCIVNIRFKASSFYHSLKSFNLFQALFFIEI